MKKEASSDARVENSLAFADTLSFRRVADALPELIAMTDTKGNVAWRNKAWLSFVGGNSGIDGLPWGACELINPTNDVVHVATVVDVWQQGLTSQQPFVLELSISDKTSEDSRYFEASITPFKDDAGLLLHWVVTLHDQSAHHQLCQSLRDSVERFQRACEGTRDGIWDFNLKTREIYWNDRFYEILGFTRDEISPGFEQIRARLHPHDQERVTEAFFKAVETGDLYRSTYRVRHKNGHYLTLMSRGKGVRDEQGDMYRMVGAVTDITDQKRAEASLKESESRFENMANASPALIWLGSHEGERTYFSVTWLQFTGLLPNRADLASAAPVSLGEEKLNSLLAGGWLDYIHPEDRVLYTAIQNEAIRLEQPCETEYRLRRYDHSYRWVLERTNIRSSDEGEILGYIGFCIDIQERRENEEELRHYATLLQKSNRELEQFTAIASHDLQEPLRKIRIFADMVQDFVPEEGKDYLERMQRAAARMQNLISDLLALSRISRREQVFAPVNLSAVMATLMDDLQMVVQEANAQVYVASLSDVYGDESQIYQLLQNIIGNALKYKHADRSPVIRVTGAYVKASTAYRVTIADNGIGIHSDYFEKIFEPFQRLHEMGRYPGTGMGLAICRKIIDRHHGDIQVESVLNEGTKFHILLPIESLEGQLANLALPVSSHLS